MPIVVLVRDSDGLSVDAPVMMSSSDPSVVQLVEGEPIAVARSTGVARVRASVGELECDGEAQFFVLPPRDTQKLRVVAIDERSRLPLVGANVTASDGVATVSATTSRGFADLAMDSSVAWIEVSAPGFARSVIHRPFVGSRKSIRVGLTRTARAGTVARGTVGQSQVPRADVRVAFVQSSLSLNPLDDVVAIPSDVFIETDLNLPDIGRTERREIRGSVLFALGIQPVTVGPVRCGDEPTNALGCFIRTAPRGPGAFSARVAPLNLSTLGRHHPDSFPVDRQIDTLYGRSDLLKRRFGFVWFDDLAATDWPPPEPCLLEFCPEPTPFEPQFVEITPGNVWPHMAFVVVPKTPLPDAEVAVAARAQLAGRGTLNLGTNHTHVEQVGDVPASIEAPFGESSFTTGQGIMPLVFAPPHGGLERSPFEMVWTAKTLRQGRAFVSGSKRAVTNSRKLIRPQSDFLPLAQTRIDMPAHTAYWTSRQDVDFVRIVFERGVDTTIVYAPAQMGQVELPREVSAGDGRLTFQSGEGVPYSEMFDLDAPAIGARLNRWTEQPCDALGSCNLD